MAKLPLDADKKVTLCGRKFAPCCPKMYRTDDGMVGISDDYGGTVKMPLEDARLLGAGVETVEDLFAESAKMQLLSD